MKEFIYSRNAVYETLRANRREIFRLQIAEGAQEKGRLEEILRMATERKIPVERVPRPRLDKLHSNHQGIAVEVGPYPPASMVHPPIALRPILRTCPLFLNPERIYRQRSIFRWGRDDL